MASTYLLILAGFLCAELILCLNFSIFAILFLCAVICATSNDQCLQPCPDGWTRFEESCYLIGYHQSMSFVEAEHYCRQHHSGHVVHVDSSRENTFLVDELEKTDVHSAWIGLTDMDTEGLWRWYDNSEYATFTYWYPGQPNTGNKGTDEDCVVYIDWDHDKAYNWQDYPCSSHFPPICEKDPCADEPGSIIG